MKKIVKSQDVLSYQVAVRKPVREALERYIVITKDQNITNEDNRLEITKKDADAWRVQLN